MGVGNRGGAGLLGILFYHQLGVKYFIIDLPEMISFSSAITATFLPEAKILLPNEIKDSFSTADFVFLLPSQVNMIPDNSISLSINVESFMEMKMSEIISYFELIQRVAKPNSLFFTTNRHEKVPGLGDTEKRSFFEYPWNRANQDIFIRVSPLHQEVKHHLMMQRLQRIIK